jgi:hypothetical protein
MPSKDLLNRRVINYLLQEQTALEEEFRQADSDEKMQIKRTLIPIKNLITQFEGKSPEEMKRIINENRFSLKSSPYFCEVIIEVNQILGEPHKVDSLHQDILQFLEKTKERFEEEEYEPRQKHLKELRGIVTELDALPMEARAARLQTMYNEKSMFSSMRKDVIGVLLEKYKTLETEHSNATSKTISNPLSGNNFVDRYRHLTENSPQTQAHGIEDDLPKDEDEPFTPKN